MITLNKKSLLGRIVAFSCWFTMDEGSKPMPTNICAIGRELVYAMFKGIATIVFIILVLTVAYNVFLIPLLYPVLQFFPNFLEAIIINSEAMAYTLSIVNWSVFFILYAGYLVLKYDYHKKIVDKLYGQTNAYSVESDTSKFVKAYNESKLNKICINVEWKDDE